jgi:predicted DNA-binding transcriptional regulator AlpA
MEIENRRWLHPREVAGLYGISVKHVYELLAKGLIPGTKRLGFGWLCDRRRLEAELEAAIEMREGNHASH